MNKEIKFIDKKASKEWEECAKTYLEAGGEINHKEATIKQLEEAYNKNCNSISLVKNYNDNKHNKYWSWAMFNTCLLGVVGARIVFEWILEPIVKVLFK